MVRKPRELSLPPTRILRSWLCWWISLAALWLLLAGKLTWVEAVGAAVGAGLAASAGVLVRERIAGPASADVAWLRDLLPVPGRVLIDWADLVRALAMRAAGRPSGASCRQLPYAPARRGKSERSREALTILAGSVAPNAYVITIEPGDRQAVVHFLVDHGRDPLPESARPQRTGKR